MKISICLNTYRRSHLYLTLCSLAKQRLSNNMEIEIVVTDNDKTGFGKKYVDRFMARRGVLVDYAIEPVKNIALARNRCIARATGEWIAFLDDDEIAAEDWLWSLVKCIEKYDADAALGTVTAKYPPESAKWLVDNDPFSKNWANDGSRVWGGSTCNSMVRREHLTRLPYLFDPSMGHAGCDDTDLFFRLACSGSKIFMCGSARVYESITQERISNDYLKRRFTRIGEATAKIYQAETLTHRPALYVTRCLSRACFFLLISCFYWLLHKSKWLRFKILYWKELGKIRTTLRLHMIEMYK